MNVDTTKIKSYIMEIKKNSTELRLLIQNHQLIPDTVPMKAAKYMLIEIAEAISNILQHILARQKGIAVSGYVDTIIKAKEHCIISEKLFKQLKPFFDFRNSLIHRYWVIDDSVLINNIIQGIDDFDTFIREIENYLNVI
ncbi:MAG: HepT-like ribonuclease domain-containing protein [Spirochaetota bacterium]